MRLACCKAKSVDGDLPDLWDVWMTLSSPDVHDDM
jgi:hypothetical protein